MLSLKNKAFTQVNATEETISPPKMSVLLSLLDPTSVLVGGVLVLCLLWWLSTRQPPGLPPGPGPALPLLGHLHLLPKDPRPQLWTWRRQYGDVVSLYMGAHLTVVLTSYSAIREALVTMADVFSDRPNDFNMTHVIQQKGVIGSSGATWKKQRKVSLEILRHMGLGRHLLAEKIQEEITHYIQYLGKHQWAPLDIGPITKVSVSNNICSVAFGKRYDYDDLQFTAYLYSLTENFQLLAGTAVLNYLPFLDWLPGDLFKRRRVLANIHALHDFIGQHVKDHQRALAQEEAEGLGAGGEGGKGEEGEGDGEGGRGEREEDGGGDEQQRGGEKHLPRGDDFIFSYLRHIRELREKGVVDAAVNEAGLKNVVSDLFIAGSETTALTIQWTLLYFLHYPHVQDRCFQEINDVIGPHRRPAMSDRPDLPYLEATIWEVLRKSDITPLAGPRFTACDVTFRGYVIPKDTVVLPFLSSVLQDPEIWGDPENFRPERFIGPDGKATGPEEMLPFGLGPRMCLGKSIATMELFLYTARLLQHFRFLPAPEDEERLPSLDGVFGITVSPQPFRLRVVPRV